MVARAAPVTMFVAPGPIDEVQASVDIRFRVLANAAAACTMACSLRPCQYRRPDPGSAVSSASSSAWPRPATLPCPKMPKQPSMSRCRVPSRSLC